MTLSKFLKNGNILLNGTFTAILLTVGGSFVTAALVNEDNQEDIEDIFIRGRKRNISAIYISQAYHTIPRIIRKNTTDVIFFNPSTRREIITLAGDFAIGCDNKEFSKLVEGATKIDPNTGQRNFLYIDTRAPGKELRYRKNFDKASQWNEDKLAPRYISPIVKKEYDVGSEASEEESDEIPKKRITKKIQKAGSKTARKKPIKKRTIKKK